MSGISLRSLRRLNLLAAALDLIQGSVLIALSTNLKLPVTGSYLAYNDKAKEILPTSHLLFHVPLIWLVALIFLISGAAHLLMASGLRREYEAGLKQTVSPIRWIEYGLVGGLIMIVLGMLTGIYNIDVLYLIFGLTALMCLLGWVMERINASRGHVSWMVYVIGISAGFLPWLIVGHALRLSAQYDGGPAIYVYFLFVSMFITFGALAVNMVLYYRRYKQWSDYLYSEKSYLWIGMATKALLAWQVYAGILHK